MGKHEYIICDKCKGKGYCGIASNNKSFCDAFVSKHSDEIWKNPTPDVFDKLQQLKMGKKVIL